MAQRPDLDDIRGSVRRVQPGMSTEAVLAALDAERSTASQSANMTSVRVVDVSDIDAVRGLVGLEIRPTVRVKVDQALIYVMRLLSGDHSPLHHDSSAAAKGPFGVVVAHGRLVTVILPALLGPWPFKLIGAEEYPIQAAAAQKFRSPVPVPSTVRAEAKIIRAAVDSTDTGVIVSITFSYKVFTELDVLVQEGTETIGYRVIPN